MTPHIQIRPWDVNSLILGHIDAITLERRLFNGISFFAALTAILVTALVLLFDLPTGAKILAGVAVVLTSSLYLLSRNTRVQHYVYAWSFLVAILLILNVDYFVLVGYQGIALPLFITISGCMPLILPPRQTRAAMGLLLSIALLMLVIPWLDFFPMPQSEGSKGGMLQSIIESQFLALGLTCITFMVISRYRQQQKTLEKMAGDLESKNAKLIEQNEALIQASEEIHSLKGIIPICSFCKCIRTDEGYYEELEEFIARNTDLVFSHGFCPECAKKHYPEIFEE